MSTRHFRPPPMRQPSPPRPDLTPLEAPSPRAKRYLIFAVVFGIVVMLTLRAPLEGALVFVLAFIWPNVTRSLSAAFISTARCRSCHLPFDLDSHWSCPCGWNEPGRRHPFLCCHACKMCLRSVRCPRCTSDVAV